MSETPLTDKYQSCYDGTFLPAMERMERALRAVRRDLTEPNGELGAEGGCGSIYDALECESREHWANHAIRMIDEALG